MCPANILLIFSQWVLQKPEHKIETIGWKLPSITRIKHGHKFEDQAPLFVDTMPKTSYMELRNVI